MSTGVVDSGRGMGSGCGWIYMEPHCVWEAVEDETPPSATYCCERPSRRVDRFYVAIGSKWESLVSRREGVDRSRVARWSREGCARKVHARGGGSRVPPELSGGERRPPGLSVSGSTPRRSTPRRSATGDDAKDK